MPVNLLSMSVLRVSVPFVRFRTFSSMASFAQRVESRFLKDTVRESLLPREWIMLALCPERSGPFASGRKRTCFFPNAVLKKLMSLQSSSALSSVVSTARKGSSHSARSSAAEEPVRL